MQRKVNFYYFSPTGGTKKVGEIFSREISESVNFIDLAKEQEFPRTDGELAAVAAPVFGGRGTAFHCAVGGGRSARRTGRSGDSRICPEGSGQAGPGAGRKMFRSGKSPVQAVDGHARGADFAAIL